MCSCCNANYYDQTLLLWANTFFVRASKHLGVAPLTGKLVKMSKKSPIFDHTLLDGHKVSFDNFCILLKESNVFKLQLKNLC